MGRELQRLARSEAATTTTYSARARPRKVRWSKFRQERHLKGRFACGIEGERTRKKEHVEKIGGSRSIKNKKMLDCYNFSLAAAIPECSDILKRNDIWIADSGATCHSTFCARGGRNGKAAIIASRGITGDEQFPSQVFDLENCTILSKEGNSRGRCSLTEINYSED